MRVLVVDDSAFMRKALSQMIAADPALQVIGTARDGREALEFVEKLHPDVITLDIEMPVMDGLTALRQIMRRFPTPVLMVSSLTTEGSHAALTALKLGAVDVLAKDVSQVSLSITNIADELRFKLRVVGAASMVRPAANARRELPPEQIPVFRRGQFDVVCIGSSTGGPPVLETILTALPADLSTPIVVAQHMPEMFTRSLAERLADLCAVPVVHAADGMALERGTIYIAPGQHHIHLRKVGLARHQLIVNHEPASALFRPSVDALFFSAAAATGARTLGIVLTGIGEDGLQGARALADQHAVLLAQSQETCAVYGMPKAVTQAGLVAAALAPEQIAQALKTLAGSARPSQSLAS